LSDLQSNNWMPNPLLCRSPGLAASFSRMPWDRPSAPSFDAWNHPQANTAEDGAKTDASAASTEFTEQSKEPAPPSKTAGPSNGVSLANQASENAPQRDDDIAQQKNPSSEEKSPPMTKDATERSESPEASENIHPNQIKIAQQQGYVQGLKDGMVRALADLESERQKDKEAIQGLLNELQALLKDSERLFEPLKRLSLHIAEQWVRGELSVSPQVIDRLIQEALSELGKVDTVVVASIHPDDLKRLQSVNLSAQTQIQIESDASLRPGSVRLRANDTEIQDLIEHRIENMARKLLKQPEAWMQNSALLHPEKATSIEAVEATETIPSWARQAVDIQEVDAKEVQTNATGNTTDHAQTSSDTNTQAAPAPSADTGDVQ